MALGVEARNVEFNDLRDSHAELCTFEFLDLGARQRAFHRAPAALACEQRARQTHEFQQRRERAREDHIERRRTQLLVVPTNDWRQVKDYHLENSLFRAVENGDGVVRAASNGVSAIVSPRGEVLAARDHLRDGPGVIVADVPLRRGGTLYSFAGDGFVAVAALGLAAGLALTWRARRRAARASSKAGSKAAS